MLCSACSGSPYDIAYELSCEDQQDRHYENVKHLFLLLFISVVLLSFSVISVNAESGFEIYLNDFYQKQAKASKILKEIETDLKDGSRDRVCARQREAASYGIEATESLIKAFKTNVNGSKTEMKNLQAGLDKWRELRDYC